MVSEQDFGESIYPDADFCVALQKCPCSHVAAQSNKYISHVVSVVVPVHVPFLEIEMNSRMCSTDCKLIVCISKMPLYFGCVAFILLSSITVLLVTSHFLLYFPVHYHIIHRSTRQKRMCSCQLKQLFSILEIRDLSVERCLGTPLLTEQLLCYIYTIDKLST